MKRLTIVNVDGIVVEDPQNLKALIRDFAAIEGLKLFVHGEGTMASMVAEKMGITIRQTGDGRDIIDDRVMDLVTMVYGGLVNKRLVAIMQWRGLNAVGLTGVDLNLVQSTKVQRKDRLAVAALLFNANTGVIVNAAFAKVGGNSELHADAPTSPGRLSEAARYGIDGRRLGAPSKGLNIVRLSDGSVRKVIVR